MMADVRLGGPDGTSTYSPEHSRVRTTGNEVNAIGSSLRDLDRLHPLIAGIIGGLISVALLVLLAPYELDRLRAWGMFIAIGAGVGLGRWLHFRAKDSRPASE